MLLINKKHRNILSIEAVAGQKRKQLTPLFPARLAAPKEQQKAAVVGTVSEHDQR